MNKQLLVQGFLYTLIAALTPVMALLSSDRPLDRRQTIAVVLAGVVAGATALKAFLSTTFAQSSESELPNPPLAMRRNSK
jgi:carbon starvation protein CstA